MSKNLKSKPNIHDEYLSYHEKYQKKYGEKTVVLMQVGSFHEAYATETRGPKLNILSETLNIVCTRKDKSINTIDEKNPYMLGFPSPSISKYLKILIDNNYTVIVIDQTTPPPSPVRAVTGIYSPSTFIDNVVVESKYLMVLYIETIQALNSSKNNISIGMCAIETSTGVVNYYETNGSGTIDENEAIEEAQRYYHFYRPVELIVYEINNKNKIKDLKDQKDQKDQNKKIINKIDILPNQVMFEFSSINPEYTKLIYQIKCLEKIYKEYIGLCNPIEFFNMEKYPNSITALIAGFDYIKQHNEKLLNELQTPKFFDEHKYMILANNAQYQLNVVDYFNYESLNAKFQSLNDIVNNCATPMGKRYLKQRLCAPFTNPTIINNYYNLTEKLLKTEKVDEVRSYLKSVCDLDKILRKISIKYIHPYELYTIYNSFENITEIINLLLKTKLKPDILELFTKNEIKEFNNSLSYITNTFDIEKLKLNNLIEIRESFYTIGIHPDIDEIQNKLLKGDVFVENLARVLESYDKDCKLHIKQNDRDGYYLQTTLIRGKKLKSIIDKQEIIKIDEFNTLKSKDLIFSVLTGNMKISYPDLVNHSNEMDDLKNKLNELIKNYFINDISKWYNGFINIFKKIINLTIQIDLIANNAFTAKKYHYSKPILEINNDESFFDVKGLRHPIIERLISDTYITHDISLNNEIKGMMIYGPNSTGKSSIMKAIGLCIIMAQSGMYVPADSFNYGIFTAIYTRISGGDNLFRAQSSFVVEMNELRTILKKANNQSIVLGDEIAKGSENLSATSIVASAIVKMTKSKTKFIFASHLHELPKLSVIQKLNNIKFCYLTVEEKNGELIFTRNLRDGTGESFYGITIANYILDDPEFINDALNFRNELLEQRGINYKIINDKKSIYNKEIYMDSCYICNSQEKLETHHINFQKDFKQTINGLINEKKKHLLKDDLANLVVLCNLCHDKLHNNEFKISAMVKTTKGIKAITE